MKTLCTVGVWFLQKCFPLEYLHGLAFFSMLEIGIVNWNH